MLLRKSLSASALIFLISFSLRSAEPVAEGDKALRGFLAAHCQDCHGPKVQKAGLRLDTLSTNYSLRQNADRWREVLDRLNAGDMPPEPRPRPKAPELLAVSELITENLKKAEAARLANGGKVVLHRLNRTQYENTIRDLFGMRIPVKGAFPEDPPQFGFDNIGSALNVSAPLLDKYVDIAEKIVDRVVCTGKRPDFIKEHFDAARLDWRVAEMAAAGKNIKSVRVPRGPAFREHDPGSTQLGVRADGEYIVRLHLSGVRRSGSPPPRLLARLDETNDILFEQDVETPEDQPTTLQARLWLAKGDYHLVLRNILLKPAIHDTFDWKDKSGTPLASMLLIDWLEWEGPIVDGWPTKAHQQIFFRGPEATKDLNYAREILSRFMDRACRRPAAKGEVDRMMRIVLCELNRKESFEEAIKLALAAVICSPEFLFLVEPASDKTGQRRLNDWELASRLSYFLWSTMPDDELFTLAQAGRLHEKEVLDGQVQRMLKDPKSSALVDNFAFQWMQLGKIGQFRPDAELYPDYDRHLELSMVQEAKAFFAEVLKNDLSVWNFIDSEWAMLNERLARHYGIAGVTGDHFRKVELKPNQHRGGLLTQAGILSLTSDGTRHRPVNRGVWMLETILANPPPPRLRMSARLNRIFRMPLSLRSAPDSRNIALLRVVQPAIAKSIPWALHSNTMTRSALGATKRP